MVLLAFNPTTLKGDAFQELRRAAIDDDRAFFSSYPDRRWRVRPAYLTEAMEWAAAKEATDPLPWCLAVRSPGGGHVARTFFLEGPDRPPEYIWPAALGLLACETDEEFAREHAAIAG
jgi:hypothetical protein